jgi:hypothetical protein
VEDKLTLSIRSLHNDFLEAVMEYCKDQPDLSAGYNQDLEDCRRSISVSCSQNKKGIAAKKALIEKFFPQEQAVPDERFEEDCCVDCTHCRPSGKRSGHPFQYKCFNASHRPGLEFYFSENSKSCENFEQAVYPECQIEDCPFNDREGACCFADEDPESDGYHRDVIGAVDGFGCKNEEVLLAYKIITDPDTCDVDEDEDRKGVEEVSNELTGTRPLTLIEAEINFYKAQAANSIFEIGKRLIEAKELVAHGEWEQWLNEKVEFSQNTAGQFMRVAKEFSNSEPVKNLGTRKLFALLGVPEVQRQDFFAENDLDTMTTRQVEAAVKEYKSKLEAEQKARSAEAALRAAAEETAAKAKEFAEKQAKYADEHMKRAREAEFKLEKKEASMNALRFDLDNARKQLADAKAKGDIEKIKRLETTIIEQVEKLESAQDVIEGLQKQLKDKPIEVPAVRVQEKVVEKTVIPDSIATGIVDKVSALIWGLDALSNAEMDIYISRQEDKEIAIEQAVRCKNRLTYIIQVAEQAQQQSECHEGSCGMCKHADMDQVTEEQLEDNKTWCTINEELVDTVDHCCSGFEMLGA